MISGFSPSLFKAVVDGEMAAEEEVAGEKVVRQKVVTPYEMVRKLLDDERYFPVREVLHASKGGALVGYCFIRPESSSVIASAQDGERPSSNEARVGALLAGSTTKRGSIPAAERRGNAQKGKVRCTRGAAKK
jgi:hypothetical protein